MRGSKVGSCAQIMSTLGRCVAWASEGSVFMPSCPGTAKSAICAPCIESSLGAPAAFRYCADQLAESIFHARRLFLQAARFPDDLKRVTRDVRAQFRLAK